MRIAVVQHLLRPAPAQDLEALVVAASRAVANGADLIFAPNIVALNDGPLREETYRRLDVEVRCPVLIPRLDSERDVNAPLPLEDEMLGLVVVLTGDSCMDAETLRELFEDSLAVLVLAPRSESELQAEAVLELALGLSTSVAPLVIVVEPDGAEVGAPGHGGSAVVHLGEMLAEAMAGDDVLLADVVTPLGRPEPRSPLPVVPPLLVGRVAAHHGRKLDVGYPADLG